MAKSKQPPVSFTVHITQAQIEMLQTALTQLAEREPAREAAIRAFAKASGIDIVVEVIDAMRNARRNSQLEMPI